VEKLGFLLNSNKSENVGKFFFKKKKKKKKEKKVIGIGPSPQPHQGLPKNPKFSPFFFFFFSHSKLVC
jgi:hypothetical protein